LALRDIKSKFEKNVGQRLKTSWPAFGASRHQNLKRMWANNKFDCNQISGKILASVWRFATSKFEKVLASVWRFATSNQNLKKVGQRLI